MVLLPTPRPPIREPRKVPVVGWDDHLPAVEAHRLTEVAVRSQFSSPPSWQPEFAGDSALVERPMAHAAVLIGLVRPRKVGEGLHVLLTQRTADLRNHAGQVSFAGGRTEPDDADAPATALREAHEEVGLDPALVEVVGCLPTYTTVTHFIVTPVVAFIDPPARYSRDEREVAAVFEVPLAHLMNPANHQRHRFEWDGKSRDFLSMPWMEPSADGAPPIERFIWGATAAMLRNLYQMLRA